MWPRRWAAALLLVAVAVAAAAAAGAEESESCAEDEDDCAAMCPEFCAEEAEENRAECASACAEACAEDASGDESNKPGGSSGSSEPKDPYEVLGVPRSASPGQIRKAYRALSRRYHPDVNSDDDATERFREIAAAFEAIGKPDARESYDRGERAGSQRTFNSKQEYDRFGQPKTDDHLFAGDEYVTRLTWDVFNGRVVRPMAGSETLWVIYFYAPWCRSCVESAPYIRAAAEVLDEAGDDVELAVARCDNSNADGQSGQRICDALGILHYPQMLLMAPSLGMQAIYTGPGKEETKEYADQGLDGPAIFPQDIPKWVRQLSASWFDLGTRSDVVALTDATFDAMVLEDEKMWLVMYGMVMHSDTLEHRANFERMCADLRPLVRCGYVDCSEKTKDYSGPRSEGDRNLCRRQKAIWVGKGTVAQINNGTVCKGGLPCFLGYNRGEKTLGGKKTPCLSQVFICKRSFNQDMLGTNIGKS
jgi:DnaJ-domain-containing protein 1